MCRQWLPSEGDWCHLIILRVVLSCKLILRMVAIGNLSVSHKFHGVVSKLSSHTASICLWLHYDIYSMRVQQWCSTWELFAVGSWYRWQVIGQRTQAIQFFLTLRSQWLDQYFKYQYFQQPSQYFQWPSRCCQYLSQYCQRPNQCYQWPCQYLINIVSTFSDPVSAVNALRH